MHELIYRHVFADMCKGAAQHSILIGTENTTLLGAEVARLNAHSTFEIVQVSAAQEIWMNAGLVHGVCTEDEYGIYADAEAKELVTHIIITDVQAVHAVAKYTSATRSDADGFQVKVGYHAILTRLARPPAYVKLVSGADDSWEEKLKESVWLQRLPSDKPAPVDVPCFSVIKPSSNQYSILDFKDDAILNLPPLLSSASGVSAKIVTILEHLSKYTFVKDLDNRRTDSLTDSDFTITVKVEADHLNPYKSTGSIIVPHESKVVVEFRNLTQSVLHFTVLNLMPLWAIKRIYPLHTELQIVMLRNPHDVLPRTMSDIGPLGVVRLQLRMKVPERLMEGQHGSVSVEDMLKFIVSTDAFRGTRSMELVDIWAAVDPNGAAVRSADETFGAPMQESLVEKSKGPGQFGGEQTMRKWACRNVKIRTIVQIS